MTQQPAWMVEAFKPGTLAPDPRSPGLEGAHPVQPHPVAVRTTVLAVIDIPSDETAFVLVAAPDPAAASDVVIGRGLRPIRVVEVRLEDGCVFASPTPAFEPGGAA